MLRMRKDQLSVWADYAKQQFICEIVESLHTYTPDHARSLGDDGLRCVIEQGIERARSVGFTQRGPVRHYIELMFLLGSDFAADPQFPWVTAVLAEHRRGMTQLQRSDGLYNATHAYLDAVAGPGNRFVIEGLEKALAGGLDLDPGTGPDASRIVLRHLRRLAPQKCQYVGEEPLLRLIHHARQTARQHAAATASDEALVVVLMFGLGHGCLWDRQFPWISRALRTGDGSQRFRRLRDVTTTYLQHAIDNLARRRLLDGDRSRGG